MHLGIVFVFLEFLFNQILVLWCDTLFFYKKPVYKELRAQLARNIRNSRAGIWLTLRNFQIEKVGKWDNS